MKPVALVKDPPLEECGPAMLDLTERQRRFVVAYLSDARDHSKCAAAAGYSTKSGGNRVAAHHMMRNQKIISAIKEHADKTLNSNAYVAAAALAEIAADPTHRDRYKAAATILDRTGFPKVEIHAVTDDTSEFKDVSTAELIRRMNDILASAGPAQRKRIEAEQQEAARVIDGEFTESAASPLGRFDADATSQVLNEGKE